MPRTLATVGLVALIVGIAVLGWWRAGRQVDPHQLHPPVDPGQWTAYVERVRGLNPPPERIVQPLLERFAALNRAEVVATDPATDVGYQMASKLWNAACLDFVRRRGAADFLDIGRRQGMRLAEQLSRLVAWSEAEGLSLDAALERDVPVVTAYIDVGGAFVRFAAEGGLLRDGRLVEDRLPFVQALFIEHWVAPLRGRVPLDAHLWAPEREWLLRWRVEYQRNGRLASRLSAADELATVPDYPAHLNAGVLLYDAGRYAEAAKRFARSPHPLATGYRRMAERAIDR